MVDRGSIDAFNKQNIKILLRIKHLTIKFPLQFSAQKMTLMNRLETIFLDCTSSSGTRPLRSASHAAMILQWLIKANQKTLQRVVMKSRPVGAQWVADVSEGLASSVQTYVPYPEGCHVWKCPPAGKGFLTWDD